MLLNETGVPKLRVPEHHAAAHALLQVHILAGCRFLRCNLKTVSEPLLMLYVLVMSRNSSLKPKMIEAEEALLELKELGPLGIPPSSLLSAACNPFATELVLKAFTDMPAVPSGAHTLFAYAAFPLLHG